MVLMKMETILFSKGSKGSDSSWWRRDEKGWDTKTEINMNYAKLLSFMGAIGLAAGKDLVGESAMVLMTRKSCSGDEDLLQREKPIDPTWNWANKNKSSANLIPLFGDRSFTL